MSASMAASRPARAALLCSLLLLAAGGCGGEASGGTPVPRADAAPSAARTAVVQAKAVQHRPAWDASGSLEPARSARLGFLVGGRLVEVRVRRGEVVAAGATLGRLDASEVGAGIAQAEAAVAAASAQLALAEDALGRLESLSGQGAVAEVELSKIRHQRDAAAAIRAQARGALQMAQVKAGQHVLRAPFAGTVLEVPEQEGAIVGPGIPQFALADLSRLRCRISLPAEAVGLVRPGQPATLTTRTGLRLEGAIALVLPALDPVTHRLPVEVEVEAPEEARGLANSFVRVRIEAEQAAEAVEVPATALVRGEETRVFVVEGGVARSRPVTVLATSGTSSVVLGLEPDCTLVDLPAADLHDGARVVR